MADLPRLAIARSVGLGYEHPACGSYMAKLSVGLANTGWFSGVEWPLTTQSRILDSRNTMVNMARERKCDYLLFLDPDMEPDVEVGNTPDAIPFFESSFKFLRDLKEGRIDNCKEGSLGIVGAPALSGPPEFKVNVMIGDDETKNGYRRATREEAMERTSSIERVVCIGTGLMLIPMEVFDVLKPPYFDDLYKEVDKSKVWSSQDSTFCMNCNGAEVSVWCNWYAWARHWKTCPIDRPNNDLLKYLNPLGRDKDTHLIPEDKAPAKDPAHSTSDTSTPRERMAPA